MAAQEEAEVAAVEVPDDQPIGGSHYRRATMALWQALPFADVQAECYAMAAMSRALTLALCCMERGDTNDVRALAATCTRWDFALRLSIHRLLGY